jgi:CheY-like chemotaxis protein
MSSPASSTKNPKRKSGEADLRGRRILVIEDSPVVAPFAAELLEEVGCTVVGPAPNLAAARELIENASFDAALLDVHIRGERIFPICEVLAARGVPFVLTSGYADWSMPEKWQDRPRLQKPYRLEQMQHAMEELFQD